VKTVIACGQLEASPGDLAGNASRIEGLAAEATRRGASLIVLPELCLCGYPTSGQARQLAVASDGREIADLAARARRLRISLCFGFAERLPDGTLRNSMALVDAAGSLVSVYRKVHLWVTEREWAVPGDRFPCARIDGLRLGMWICYDTRFPEAARSIARAGATLALAGSAWFGPAEEWDLAVRARALDNGIFVAAASLQGSFGTSAFHGASLIVDPHGRVLAQAAEGRDDVVTAEYDDDAVASFRARLPLLDNLRPEAYAD
jgi:5-aminopentanamidase